MAARVIFYGLLVYCFIYWLLARELSLNFPVGILIEVGLYITLIAAIITVPRDRWKLLNNDVVYLFLLWFVISLVEVANPAGANVIGWLKEIRSAAEYPLLIVMVCLLIFDKNEQLDRFIFIVLLFSTIAALNGVRQLHIGLSPGDRRFLAAGADVTHMLWGRLRVFSFYSEAGQFGASQAHIGLFALILALGPVKMKTKIILLCCSGLMIYGMLISGTRGAFFALLPGAFFAIILSKKFKVLMVGGAVAVLFLCFLKFTSIGSGNYSIYRFRSALDPNDPSLIVRMNSQRILREYMSSLPFGGGLGVTGANGMEYNPDKFLSKVQPDSYWVKVWIMYGIVGFTIWISIMTFLLGKCCAIVWRIRDEGLKIKAIALASGFAGILMCSYGNEVINTMPSTIIVYASIAFIYLMPKLDQELQDKKILAEA
ncbi:O-antigen ligase family protein [Pedobacter aquatilis]|uniref:O-antigen ligase family protein n=1 Tax=Pedobacter aquatilis TaxID=351343 RepID=UPI0029312EC8|nr:O-antigen ligase family protein [Pedobacter aquatilis]